MSLYDVADQFGSWQDDEIWSLGAKPTAAQDAFIGGASDFRVTSDDDVTVNSVGVASGDELEISGGSTLTATNGTVLAPSDQGHGYSYGIDGFVYVDANATFSIGDALVNFGLVAVGSDALGAAPGDMTLNGAVDFTGDGVVLLGGVEDNGATWSGDISGGELEIMGNTFEGAELISVTSLDNAAGTIIALQDGAHGLTIRASAFTNEATLEVSEGATLDLGLVGATQSLTNTGEINIGSAATLAISGNYTINGSGAINFDGFPSGIDVSIVSDLSAGDAFTNGAASSIHADVTGEIGNGASISAAFNLTFYNYGDVYASGAGVTLTIDTGANTVYDRGGLLEADDGATLVIDSPVQMGQYYFLTSPEPAGGTIEATSGGTVEIGSAVANGPRSKVASELQASGQVVVAAGGTVVVESGGSVSVPIEIDGTSGSTAGGVATLDAGGSITGTVYFETEGATLNLFSTSSTVNVSGSGGTVNLTSSQVSIFGGFDTVYFSGGSGNAANLSGTGDDSDTVYGSNGTVYLNDGQANVVGSDDTIYFSNASGNVVVLFGTSDNFDGVYGSGGTVELYGAQASVTGGGDAIYFAGGTGNAASLYGTGGNGDAVYGSSGTVYLTSAQASIVGGFDTIYFSGGSGNSANLSGTGGNSDTVYGSNGTTYLTSAQVSVVGGDDTIYFYGGSGNTANLFSTSSHSDTVYGSSGKVTLTSAQVSMVGGGDTTYFSGGSGNSASLFSTGGVWDSVYGSNGSVALTSAQASVWGGGDTTYFSGGSGNVASLYNTGGVWDSVYGSSGTVALTGAQATVSGNGNSVDFYGTNNWLSAIGGSEAFVFQPAIGQDTINGFVASDSMTFSASDFANFNALSPHISQSGSNTLISLDANDTVTLTNVTATSLTASQFHFV